VTVPVRADAGLAVAAEYGLEFVDTPWLDDVVRRFRLHTG
jgi:hypothetical protein